MEDHTLERDKHKTPRRTLSRYRIRELFYASQSMDRQRMLSPCLEGFWRAGVNGRGRETWSLWLLRTRPIMEHIQITVPANLLPRACSWALIIYVSFNNLLHSPSHWTERVSFKNPILSPIFRTNPSRLRMLKSLYLLSAQPVHLTPPQPLAPQPPT